jgi:hypothetical protein
VALTREEQNERNRQAAAIGALLKNPGWAEMERALERKIANQRDIVLAYALNPDGADQRKIDQARGTIGALSYILGLPKAAEGRLNRWLEQQGIEVEDE